MQDAALQGRPGNEVRTDNRPPYQILPHTNSNFHCLDSYPDLLPQEPLGYPRGAKAPGTLGATGEGLDSCKDGESSH